MPVDPQLVPLLELLAAYDGPPIEAQSPAEVRAVYATLASARTAEPEEVAEVRDLQLPGPAGPMAARAYIPDVDAGPRGVCAFFHGGGWVIGDIDTHDGLCRSLAARSGATVVSVAYRLAPETPFPGAVDDAVAATAWLADHADELGGDGARLAVAGDSAGANLAAATTLVARDRGGPDIAFQLLVYPALDHGYKFPSCTENAEGYFLTLATMRWFTGHYLSDPALVDHPLASPLRSPDLSGLPPALIITAEFDLLRDEGEAYAARLVEAGVDARAHRYDGMIHGFAAMRGVVDAAEAALDECAAALHSVLGPKNGVGSLQTNVELEVTPTDRSSPCPKP